MPLYSTCGQIEDKLRTSGDHQAVHTELKGLCVSLRMLHEQVTPREEPLADGASDCCCARQADRFHDKLKEDSI